MVLTTTRAAVDLILFSPEAVQESFGGYADNLGRIGTAALCAFLILLGVVVMFDQIRRNFR